MFVPPKSAGPARYSCRVCEKAFVAEQNRVRHQYKAHAVISHCRECKDYLVPGNNGGKVHARRHTDNPTRCNCCLSIWRSPVERNTHVQMRRAGCKEDVEPLVWTTFQKEWRNGCHNDAGPSTFVPANLNDDEEEEEDVGEEDEEEDVSPAPSPSPLRLMAPRSQKAPKVYSCKLCTKQYANGNSLKYHTFSIHGVRSFCTTCEKNVAVGRDGGMKHAKGHHKKPQACRCCRAVWKNSKELRVHLKDRDEANVTPAVWTEFTASKNKENRGEEGVRSPPPTSSPPTASSLKDPKTEIPKEPVLAAPLPAPIPTAQQFSVIQHAPPAAGAAPVAPIDPTLLLLLLNALSNGSL